MPLLSVVHTYSMEAYLARYRNSRWCLNTGLRSILDVSITYICWLSLTYSSALSLEMHCHPTSQAILSLGGSGLSHYSATACHLQALLRFLSPCAWYVVILTVPVISIVLLYHLPPINIVCASVSACLFVYGMCQYGLELVAILQPPKCWGYRFVSSCLAIFVFKLILRKHTNCLSIYLLCQPFESDL